MDLCPRNASEEVHFHRYILRVGTFGRRPHHMLFQILHSPFSVLCDIQIKLLCSDLWCGMLLPCLYGKLTPIALLMWV